MGRFWRADPGRFWRASKRFAPATGPGPSATVSIPCSAAANVFSVTAPLFAGVQQLRISSYDTSSLPFFTAASAPVSVTAGSSTTVDLARRLAGSIVVNGAPQPNCPAGTEAGTLLLRGTGAATESVVVRLLCGPQGSISFDTWVAPGTYEVRVRGEAPSTLPAFVTTLVRSLQIP